MIAPGTPCRPVRPTAVPRMLAMALLAGVATAGCAADTTASPGTGAPTSTFPTSAASDPPASDRVRLPWPAATVADAAALQAEVDRGAQPWLLDPSEVAIAYAAAAYGRPDAEAYPGPNGTSVDVRNAEGERLTLSLVQPGRAGSDGIWVVTAERR